MTKYTMADLRKVKADYNKNFDMIMFAVKKGDKELHLKYIKEEKRLNLKNKDILRELHILMADMDEGED